MDKTLAKLIEHIGSKFEAREGSIFYVAEDIELNLADLTEAVVADLVTEGKVEAASDLDKVDALVSEAEKNNFFKKKDDNKGAPKKDADPVKAKKPDGAKDVDDVEKDGKKGDTVDDAMDDQHKGKDKKPVVDDESKKPETTKKKKKDDVTVKESEDATDLLAVKIKDALVAEGIWDVPEETATIIEQRKSVVDRLVAEDKYEKGERDFAMEFYAESFEDFEERSSIPASDVIFEDVELANGTKMVRIKYNADKASLVEGFLKEGIKGALDSHIVDPESGKSLVSILGESFSKDDMDSVLTIFEAAVDTRVKGIQEKYDAVITERARAAVDSAVRAIDEMASEVIAEWVDENRPSITDSVKMQSMTSLVSAVKSVFESHGLDVIDADSDLVEGLVSENAEFKTSSATLAEENAALKAELHTIRASAILESASEGLSMAQKEKLGVMMEDTDKSDLDAFEAKTKLVAERFFGAKPAKKTLLEDASVDDVITEGMVDSPSKSTDKYADFLRRSNRVSG